MPELALEKIAELTRMIYATSLMTPTTKLGLSTRVKGRPNALRERYAAPSTSTTGDWGLSFFRWVSKSHFATWNPKNFPGPLRTYLSGYPLVERTVHICWWSSNKLLIQMWATICVYQKQTNWIMYLLIRVSALALYDTFHWKCYTPKIQQIAKLKSIGTNNLN